MRARPTSGAMSCAAGLLALLLLASCQEPRSVACANGGVCPDGLACVEVDGADRCVLPSCGDGRLDPGEACDDGNHASGDGCPGDCAAPCGDGQLDPSEACDDGNTLDGDGCPADCAVIEGCGNGRVERGESCDDGAHANRDGCSARCALEPVAWLTTSEAPTPRRAHAMAYDARRGVIVLFGGRGEEDELGDTWEWDGLWRERTPPRSPPPRAGHAMAYDAGRGRVVMFGGAAPAERSTWEWDGETWIEHTPALGPAAQLAGIAMAYDPARGATLLFGGQLAGVMRGETWIWSGEAWRQLDAMIAPPARTAAMLAHDGKHGRMVLFGGADGAGLRRDTWVLDGDGWREQAAMTTPPARARASFGFDAQAGHLVLFGGEGAQGAMGDTWRHDGAVWREVSGAAPRPRIAAAMSYDPAQGHLVLFGGQERASAAQVEGRLSSETWAHSDELGWQERSAPSASAAPIARSYAKMAYDPRRAAVVMFGGMSSSIEGRVSAELADTWAWDGARWTPLRAPDGAEVPPARRHQAMVFDGEQLMMFGGRYGPVNDYEDRDDTWILRGERWIKHAGSGPPSRAYHAMAFDRARGKVVMFGGDGDHRIRLDTWEWDGDEWTQRQPAHRPSHYADQDMSYDPTRERVVLYGRWGDLSETWEWTGDDWVQLEIGASPPPTFSPAEMFYDAEREALVIASGFSSWALLRTGDGSSGSWVELADPEHPEWLDGPSMVYDEGRRRLVGLEYWNTVAHPRRVAEWDGEAWHRSSSWLAAPTPRERAALAYDTRRGEAILFGGAGDDELRDESIDGATWRWRAGGWQLAAAAGDGEGTAPTPSATGVMAHDEHRARTVLFGAGGRDETWEWDGTRWSLRSGTARLPGGRSFAATYDGKRRQVMVLGGASPQTWTPWGQWAWTGVDWRRVETGALPPARIEHALAYDAARGVLVLFGGRGPDGALADTWEFDGARWSQVTPPVAPPARAGHALAYHAARRRVVLFGGAQPAEEGRALLDDAWEWDGAAWVEVMPSARPAARAYHVMSYDPGRRELMVFGGSSDDVDGAHPLRDTWVLRYGDPADGAR